MLPVKVHKLKRGVEAPLLITPKHLGNNVEQQKGIRIKGENDPKDSDNHSLARERLPRDRVLNHKEIKDQVE